MAKYFLPILVILFLLPLIVFAAALNWDADTNVSIGGNTYVILSGSTAASLIVGSSDITITLAGGDTFTLKSADRYLFNTNPTLGQTCSTNDNRVVVIGPVTSQVITPNTSGTCSLPGGGGGYTPPPPTPTVPTTTTGEVTATPSSGGQTTYANPEGGSAQLTVPANAITTDTTFEVQTTTASEVASAPSGYLMVGNQVYEITATSNNVSVTSFTGNLTLTFTYTDAQISGLNENTLTVYYYNSTTQSWIALPTILNTATNTATVSTNHFTNFALMGEEGVTPVPGWTPPTGYEYITGPSKVKLYKNIITEPGTHKKYGIPISAITPWTPPTGYEYITGPSKVKLYKNIITEPGTKKKYGILKTKWTSPTGYEYITGPSKIKLYKNIITEPGTVKLYGILKK